MRSLGALRREKGLTQEKLAEMLGVAQSTVTSYEVGKRTPSKDVANRIMKIFDLTVYEVWEMFYGDETEEGGKENEV